jgi:hypothetical protein
MALELTTDQARLIARLRWRWPDAEIRVHQRSWGVIVEVREQGRTLSLTAFDGTGSVLRERRLRSAA